MSVPILIVDEDDNPIGQATKQEAWSKGLVHRCVRIVLEDGKGNMLLQHRSPTKDIFPDCWDSAAAGHVDAGEDYDVAAYRELEEELGIKGIELTVVGTYRSSEAWRGHTFNRFARVYKATFAGMPPRLEVDKVDDARWFSIEEVKALVRDTPDQVTDGLRQIIEHYYVYSDENNGD